MINHIPLLLLCSSFLHAQTTLPDTQQTPFSLECAIAVHRVLAADIGPRPMGSPAERRALKFAMEKFREYGCDTAYIMTMTQTTRANTTSGIAVGVKRGATNRIIVIGGHIDSAGPEIPGADDNASGSAVVIELARVFTNRPMQSTLVFTCFGGEEQGLEGSRYFVSHFAEIDSVVLMLNTDMANGLEILDADGDAQGTSAPSWLVNAAFDEFKNLGYSNLRYPTHFFVLNYAGRGGAGSDHESFLKAGIPAIDFSTDVTRPIHTPQDNLEHFDPRGMKRSGDLTAKLVERFDGGVPDKELTNYWLYVFGDLRIFVPYWAIYVFLAVTLLCSVGSFVTVRERRLIPVDVRWSGARVLLYTVIIVFFAWISSDVVGLVKGDRYPWMADVSLYYLNAVLFAALGIWISLFLAKRLPVSQCPYVFYKRASIVLVVYTLLFLWGNTELAIYPASALFMLALSILVKNRLLKLAFILLSPLWMLRLIFSEWGDLFFRSIAATGISLTTVTYSLMYNAGMIVLFSFYLYPLVLGFVAAYRDAGSPQSVVSIVQSRGMGYTLAVVMTLMIVFLSLRESYSDLWQRTVFVEHIIRSPQSADDGEESSPEGNAFLRSAEYLDGIVIRRPQGDTTLSGRITEARIPLSRDDYLIANFQHLISSSTPLKNIRTTRNDTTEFDLLYHIKCSRLPYTVTITYSSEGETMEQFSSPLLFAGEKQKTARWYSFPDSIIVPVSFKVVGSDSLGVKERIEVVFDRLQFPWAFEREKTNFLLRTKLLSSSVYKP